MDAAVVVHVALRVGHSPFPSPVCEWPGHLLVFRLIDAVTRNKAGRRSASLAGLRDMAARFHILIPDAQYADDNEVERSVAGDLCSFETYRTDEGAGVPQEAYGRCDAMLAWHEAPMDAAAIARLSRCVVIVRCGVGYDHIDLQAAGVAGIPVCNTPDYGTAEVADHAIALVLALKRGLATYHDALRADPVGGFDCFAPPLVRRLSGAVLGILGLGRIGTATALRAKAFGLEVQAYDPYVPRGQEIALGVRRVDQLGDLLATSDVLSLHAPLTEETHGMIDAAALRAMPPHAILINTARGAIVDLDALHEALYQGWIAGAGLDVLPAEPPDPAHPLLRAHGEDAAWLRGRLIVTPHAAWWSPESQTDARRLSTETLVSYLRDGDLRNCVNGDALKQRRPVPRA